MMDECPQLCAKPTRDVFGDIKAERERERERERAERREQERERARKRGHTQQREREREREGGGRESERDTHRERESACQPKRVRLNENSTRERGVRNSCVRVLCRLTDLRSTCGVLLCGCLGALPQGNILPWTKCKSFTGKRATSLSKKCKTWHTRRKMRLFLFCFCCLFAICFFYFVNFEV